jgi:hypothetical protein
MKLVQLQLLSAVLSMSLGQLLETRYGTPGVVCLFLLGVGLRTRNRTCLTIAAVILGLLLAEGV